MKKNLYLKTLKKVRINDLWGLIDNDIELFPPKYDYIGEFKNGIAEVRLNCKCGFINNKGEEINGLKYDHIGNYYNGFAVVQVSDSTKFGKYGFVNIYGYEICEIKYINQDPDKVKFSNGLAIVSTARDANYTCINTFGVEIIPPIFYHIIRDDRYIYCKEKAYGSIMLLGKHGNVIFDLNNKYSDIIELNNNHFIVNKHRQGYGIININNEDITGFGYRKLWRHSEGLSCRDESNWPEMQILKYMNYEGHEFDKITEIRDSYRIVYCSHPIDLYGYLNKKGKLVIHCVYLNATDFYKGKALVRDENGNVLFINSKGSKIKTLKKYSCFSNPSEGIYSVNYKDLYGYIDESGKEIIELKFEDVSPFRKGIAKVKYHGLYGFINAEGKAISDFKYHNINKFIYGFSKTEIKDSTGKSLYGLINESGLEVLSNKYTNIEDYKNNQAIIVNIENKYGIIDKSGLIILPEHYDFIYQTFNEKGIAAVRLGDDNIYIDKDGNKKGEYIDYRGWDDDSYEPSFRDAFDDHPDAMWNVD